MGVAALLAELQAQGFALREVAGRLRCEGPAGRTLSPEQRDAIARSRDALLQAVRAEAGIPVVPRQQPIPASAAQRRLWYLEEAATEGPPAYNIPTLLRLRGPLDREALASALERLVARHEILRSAVVTEQGQAWLRIATAGRVALPFEELAPAKLNARVRTLALEPFDLAQAPLFRARLFRTAPNDHTLLLLQHHIVSDGWSVRLLVAELERCYRAVHQGTPELPPPRLQYADYAAWEAGRLSEAALAAKLAHWLPRLQDLQPLELPLDRPRPARLGSHGDHCHRFLPAALAEAARRLAADQRTTLFAVLLGCFKLLLLRYSGQRDLVVGTPVANRKEPELAEMLGFFINILPLRTDLTGVADVPGLIARTDETLHHALSHPDVPFDSLVAALRLPRDTARAPLFQVLFALQSANRDPVTAFDSLAAELTEEADYPIAKAELTFSLQERRGGLTLRVEWNRDLYQRATVERMAEHFERLLQAMVADPGGRLDQLPLLTAAEHRALVLKAGRNPRPYERDATPLALFAAQAAARPTATALRFDGEALSYGELADRARRLARHLLARSQPHGLPAGSRIALCLERSSDFVVAVLACLELRAVYVPLDPSYPAARLALLLADVAPALTLTHAAAGRAADALRTADTPCVDLTGEAEAIAARPADPLGIAGAPEDPAYVCYTSGTTGRPKGVTVPNRAVVRLVRNPDYVTLRPGQRIAFGSNVVFDAATFELWGALLNGGCLVGLDQDTLLDPERLERAIAAERIEVLWLTTALFEQLVERRAGIFSRLDTLLTGGSKHNPQIMRRLLDCPDRPPHLVNGYGPTENTTFSTTYAIERLAAEQASVPIGRPIANSTAYVLSPEGQPQPVGVPGELHVGGDGVALGYFRQPALTAERFLELTLRHPDCSGEELRDRVYRTGDLVRWREDLTLEFLGRRDGQVKLRGFRIELGEVEAALLAVPGVVHAVARLQDSDERPQLVAWYVAGDSGPTPEQLRAALAELLPTYMVPAALSRLAAMPLNVSGKVDLAALPTVRVAETAETALPEGPVEQALAAIWCQLLRREQVGRHESFFAIGGDSILSIQVVARARDAGLSFTPRQLFEAGSIARLAAVTRSATPALTAPGFSAEPIPLTPIQRWFFSLPLANHDHFNQALLLRLPEALDGDQLAKALGLLTARHEAFRLRFDCEDGVWRQLARPAEDRPRPPARLDLSAVPPAAQGAAIVAACSAWQSDFDLGRGELLAAGLIEGHADGCQRLFLAAHHLIVDGVSWRVILADLQRFCADLAAGRSPQPEPQDGILRLAGEALQAYAASESTGAQRAYWLAAAAGGAFLPTVAAGDRPAEQLTAELDAEATAALLERAGRAYKATIDELLLAALAAALAAWSGRRRFVVALESHGREETALPLDLSATVGWFTSLYPVALELPAELHASDANDWLRLLPAVMQTLRAVPDKGIGFGALRYLAGDAALAALSPAELSFNYLGRFEDAYWVLAAEDPGEMLDRRNPAPHPLDLTVLVVAGRLQARLSVARDVPLSAPAALLLERFLESLRSLLAHCLARPADWRTPADYPASSVSQEELERLLMGAPEPPAALYDLTPLQEGLLFHARHSDESDQYLVQLRWDLAGPLEPARLRTAWEQVVAHHAALRVAFRWQGLRRPQQLVAGAVALDWQLLDWSAADAEAQTTRYLAADRARGFDLAQPCPLRFALARLPGGRWRFIWTQHHILLDGWCLPLLLAEVAARYRALEGSAPQPEQPATLAFEDYVGWLRRQDRRAAREFWRAQLAGLEAATDLPMRRPGSRLESNRPIRRLQSLEVTPSEALQRRLTTLARGQSATLNAVLQLAWGLLLARYSGQDLVCHGTTVSGRANGLPGVERMIGLAINSLPVCQRFVPGESVGAALAKTNRLMQEINHWSFLPLPELQSECAVAAGEALFHSLLVFENYPAEGLAEAGPLQPQDLRIYEKTGYPLLLMALPGTGLQLRLDYDAELFERAAIGRLGGHLLTLLAGMAEAPQAALESLPLLTPGEQAELAAWQGPAHRFDSDTTVIQLIERQAAATPEAEAARDEAGSLTYAELMAAAERFATLLRQRHAAAGRALAADTPVGLCLERGLGMLVAILGILKAGGAYMPLDPDHPPARLQEMLEDSGALLVVTDSGLAQRLAFLGGLPPARRLCVDDPDVGKAVPEPLPPPEPDKLAYVIFTSGSTGRPKGVAVEHRGLVNRLQWMQQSYPIGPADRVLQKTPYSFDVSVWEFFWPLLTGACLVFARPQGHRDPAYLCHVIAEAGITTLHFVPSMLQAFVERPEVPSLTGMRQLFCSGEGLPTQLTQRLLTALPSLGLHNLYGPTEATVDVSWHHCRPQDADEGPITPIGRPVWNTELQVLDAHMRLTPVGVPGELWIGGVQLARGYLNRDDLTADRFRPNPFGPGRLYRTGDLVRRREDGALDYLGRTDFQVKVRGVRVELGEIEAALERHPEVRQACLVARGTAADTNLVAYYSGPRALASADLRQFLAARLPEAMVPARYLWLADFPLTTSGKIDRKALPEAPLPSDPGASAQAARDPLEAAVVRVLAEVLERDSVGPEEDFFALGGHSLKAMQVAARLLSRLGLDLPLRAIFLARTAAGIARALAAVAPGDASTPLPAQSSDGLHPLSFAQERLWFLQRFAAEPALYNVPLALRLRGPLQVAALAAALDDCLESHAILRSRIREDAASLGQVVLPHRSAALLPEEVSEDALAALLQAEARRPFELTRDAPLRCRLLRLAPEDHILCLVLHHHVTDAWSLEHLQRELAARYAARCEGRALPPVGGPDYFAYLRWQRDLLTAERRATDLAFWRPLLAGLPTLALPSDRPRPPVPSHRGALHRFALGAETTATLRAFARRAGATPFTVLLAAFALLLSRRAGQAEVAIGTPVANRQRLELEPIQGLFTNTLVLRHRIEDSSSFAELVRRATDGAIDAYAHRELPFELLVEALQLPRDPSRSPLFQAFFVLQPAPQPGPFGDPALLAEPLALDSGTAKFDLTLAFEESAQELQGCFEYAAELFDPPTIAAFAEAYVALLVAALAAPEVALGGIDLAGEPPPLPLPAPVAAPREGLRARAPQGELERRIAVIWQELLGLAQVGARDSFFDLGGSSLGMMRLQLRLREAFGRELAMVTLFAHPTVEGLASLLGDGATEPAPHEAAQDRAARRRRQARRPGRA